MKRFYKLVSTRVENGGVAVLLDGKSIKTPLKNALVASTNALAEAVAAEWAGQGEKLNFDSMPLTQILNTKIDRVGAARAEMEKIILKYLNTDLLYYRAPHPPELEQKQKDAWDKWLGWFEKKCDVKLLTTTGLDVLEQDPKAHKAAAAFVKKLDDDHFAVLQLAASLSGSLILGMAFVDKEISADDVFACARVEENHKARIYNEALHGQDPAQEKKDNAIRRDLHAAGEYLGFIKP